MLFWIGMLKSSAFLQMEPIMTIYFLQISKFTMWAPNHGTACVCYSLFWGCGWKLFRQSVKFTLTLKDHYPVNHDWTAQTILDYHCDCIPPALGVAKSTFYSEVAE